MFELIISVISAACVVSLVFGTIFIVIGMGGIVANANYKNANYKNANYKNAVAPNRAEFLIDLLMILFGIFLIMIA